MEPNPSPEKKLFLAGEYDALLDDKNRILVCAVFRNEILECGYSSSLICRVAKNKVARLYPEKYYREMIAKRETKLVSDDEEEKFNDSYYGKVFPVTWDAQGRVGIPDKIIKRAAMGRELTLVGTSNHVAIWNRQAWEHRAEDID
jgi:MraZ protein